MKIIKDIENLLVQSSKILKINWGTLKADIVLNNFKKPMLIELTSRLSGGLLSNYDIPAVYGIDIIKTLISLSINEDLNKIQKKRKISKNLITRIVFPHKSGIINKIEIPRVKTNTLKIFRYKKVGDICKLPESSSDKILMIKSIKEDPKKALLEINNFIKKIIIEIN